MDKKKIGIVGGGLTGLTTAYRLVQEGHDVTIFEASDTLGGLAAGFELDGHRVEQAYHFLYKTDEYILSLVEELGLTDTLTFHKSSVSTYYGDTLYPMETPIDLIKFNPIGFIDRIRAGVTVLYLQRVKNWKSLSKITALDWLRKYAGKAVTDVIWEPLLKGKFDRYYDKVTMSWLWGRVLQRVDSRDAKLGGEALGYFKGGFKTVIDAVVNPIKEAGADIRFNSPVGKMRYDDATDQVQVETKAGVETFDRVLATVPSHVFTKMIGDYEDRDPDYFRKLNSIDYLDAAVLCFATDQKITDYYWHNVNTPNSPFVVFLSLTALVGPERFDGKHVYYIGDYIPAEHEYMSMPEEDLKARWYGELKKMFPDFDPSKVIDDGLFRMRNAQHIVDIGFEETKLVPHETPCPGVFMCNFAQIFPMDRGTNYAVRDGNRMATKILESFGQRPTGPLKDAPLGGGLSDIEAVAGEDSLPMAAREASSEKGLAGAATGKKSLLSSLLGWVSKRPRLTALGAAGFAAGLMGASFFGGFLVGERELPTYGFFKKVDGKLASFLPPQGKPQVSSSVVSSALLLLKSEVGYVPVGRSTPGGNPLGENGGGLTSFGEDVLLLPYNGQIYAASSKDDIRATGLSAPYNNRAEYQALANDPAYADYNIQVDYLRYNDLQYYSSDLGHGLVASYTEYHPEDACYTNTLAKLPFAAGLTSIDEVNADDAEWEVLYRTSPCMPLKTRHGALEGHMAGGRMAFRAPGTIIVTVGDFHNDGMRSEGRGIAQDPSVEYGKVMEVDIATGNSRMLSIGHRNPQGITLDLEGRIMVAEHGPAGGDELNEILEGENYGWPIESYGITYRGTPMPEAISFGRHEQFEAPLHSWVPSIAVSGITQIDGFHEAWDGDLIASSMIGQSLHRIRRQSGRVVYVEPIPMGTRIRYVHQHTDGRLVLWTDNEELIFLTAEDKGSDARLFEEYVSWRDLSPRMASKLEAAVGRCAECHSFALGDHAKAPGLARIFDDPIGKTPYGYYSDGLKRKRGTWTAENLEAFLTNPQEFAPGTVMPPLPDNDPAVVKQLVDYLEEVEKRF